MEFPRSVQGLVSRKWWNQSKQNVTIVRLQTQSGSNVANLPYMTTPGTIKTALDKIRSAATPPRVTTDFVTTVLQIKGGTGSTVTPFLKKIGFVASDGAPTDIYKRFRNPDSAGRAMADAIRLGYQELLKANEYFYRLDDKGLLALIVQVTGAEAESRSAALTQASLKILKSYANFDANDADVDREDRSANLDSARQSVTLPASRSPVDGTLGLNLSYTINLNLPATSDQAVFNAIFRSLKEHLLSSNE